MSKLRTALVDGLGHQVFVQLRRPSVLYTATLLICIVFGVLVSGKVDRSFVGATGMLVLLSFVINGVLAIEVYHLRREAALRAEAERKLALTLNTMRDGIAAFDADQRLVVANRRYQEIYALPDELVQRGTPFIRIIDTLRERQPSIPPPEEFIRRFLLRLNAGDTSPISMQMQNLAVSVSYLPRPGGGWVSTHEDVTVRTQMEKRLEHLAHHDALTDLANRVLLCQQLDRALKAPHRGKTLAVLCLDLDRFKEVNDTMGHSAGDELLCKVAARLRACVEKTDTAARIGGDEFAIMQFGPQPESSAKLAAEIIGSVEAPYTIEEQNVVIGTSIGIAIHPDHGLQATELLKNADLALYVAKAERRGSHRFFESWMERRKHNRRRSV